VHVQVVVIVEHNGLRLVLAAHFEAAHQQLALGGVHYLAALVELIAVHVVVGRGVEVAALHVHTRAAVVAKAARHGGLAVGLAVQRQDAFAILYFIELDVDNTLGRDGDVAGLATGFGHLEGTKAGGKLQASIVGVGREAHVGLAGVQQHAAREGRRAE
nr:hypothetical protein [Tanacetum cinerariifolium]